MNPTKTMTALGLTLCLGACSQYVKQEQFDSTVADLRSSDASLQASDRDLRARLEDLDTRFSSMSQDIWNRLERYDTVIADMQGRLRVDMTAHFAYDDATLREQDKPALAEFSEVVRDYEQNVLVTVEGFTDPAGSPEYNEWLGMERARAVRAYLIETGLSPDRVRAVSYGESTERLVAPGAWGQAGEANRRVALVIDYVAS